MILKNLFGNLTAERVLLFLANYGEGFAMEIARTFGSPLSMVQKQLKRLEGGGILVSQLKGKTRLYKWNPRYPFLKELLQLLNKSLESLSENDTEKYYLNRTRPRRAGKPL